MANPLSLRAPNCTPNSNISHYALFTRRSRKEMKTPSSSSRDDNGNLNRSEKLVSLTAENVARIIFSRAFTRGTNTVDGDWLELLRPQFQQILPDIRHSRSLHFCLCVDSPLRCKNNGNQDKQEKDSARLLLTLTQGSLTLDERYRSRREAQFGKPFILAHIRNATGTEEEIGMTEVLMKGG